MHFANGSFPSAANWVCYPRAPMQRKPRRSRPPRGACRWGFQQQKPHWPQMTEARASRRNAPSMTRSSTPGSCPWTRSWCTPPPATPSCCLCGTSAAAYAPSAWLKSTATSLRRWCALGGQERGWWCRCARSAALVSRACLPCGYFKLRFRVVGSKASDILHRTGACRGARFKGRPDLTPRPRTCALLPRCSHPSPSVADAWPQLHGAHGDHD